MSNSIQKQKNDLDKLLDTSYFAKSIYKIYWFLDIWTTSMQPFRGGLFELLLTGGKFKGATLTSLFGAYILFLIEFFFINIPIGRILWHDFMIICGRCYPPFCWYRL